MTEVLRSYLSSLFPLSKVVHQISSYGLIGLPCLIVYLLLMNYILYVCGKNK